jgi:hypothetical protein
LALGSFADLAYTVSNSGQLDATSVALSGLFGDWSVAGVSCGATIAAGSSCTVDVRFAPTSLGPSAESLLLDYDDGTGPVATVTVAVSGVGVAARVSSLHGVGLWLLLPVLCVTGLRDVQNRSP